ncbi:MAG: DUF5362 family protein [bacterium]|jgi:uncharacterized membrane protein
MDENQYSIEEKVVKEVSMPLYTSKGWLKLIGILMLIYGVLIALTVVGIIVAWLPIWIGIILMQAAARINEAQITGRKEALIKAQSSLSTYFTVYGVLALIGLIAGAISIIVLLTTGVLTNLQDFGADYY